jgi:glutaredoxin
MQATKNDRIETRYLMEIVVYTMPGCSHCKTVKQLFQRANVNYTEYILHKDISISELKEKYPSINNFPFIVIDDDEVGGLMETAKLFLEKGLVSSRKNNHDNS